MLDKLSAFGAMFDWITPLVAGIKDLANGPHHTLLIPHDCGWSGRAIERLLRRNGVKTWGAMIVRGLIMITVPLAQAYWAYYLLSREGIPIQSAPPERPRSRSHRGRRVEQERTFDRAVDDVLDFIDPR